MTLTLTRTSHLTVLVAGGAGFIGSHLCEALLLGGSRVICLDSFLTGSRANLRALIGHRRFTLIEHDICTLRSIRHAGRPGLQSGLRSLAAALPGRSAAHDDDQRLRNGASARHGRDSGARFVQASTSEVYGDPEEHPQHENYGGASIAPAHAPAMTKASGPPRRCASTLCAASAPTPGWRGSSTPMARAWRQTMAGSFPI